VYLVALYNHHHLSLLAGDELPWDFLDDFVEIHGISMGKIHGQNHPTNPWIEDIRRIGVEKPTVVITFFLYGWNHGFYREIIPIWPQFIQVSEIL